MLVDLVPLRPITPRVHSYRWIYLLRVHSVESINFLIKYYQNLKHDKINLFAYFQKELEFHPYGVLGFWGDRKSTRLNSSH